MVTGGTKMPGSVPPVEVTHMPLEHFKPEQHTEFASHAVFSARQAQCPPSQRVPAQHTLWLSQLAPIGRH
jgi:hypothetical protein